MKKLAAILAALPASALAHPGHYAEAAGHSHWLAAAALAVAGLITVAAVAGVLARRAKSEKAERR
jgi:hypothetical protein